MAIYLVTPLTDNYDKIKDAIDRNIPESDVYVVPTKMGFFVRSQLTAMELTFLLGISTPDRSPTELGPAMVTAVNSYYGRAPVPMWEWLKSRMEKG